MPLKNYLSTLEGNWKEVNRIDFTPEQLSLFLSTDPEDRIAKRTLVESVRAQTYTNVAQEKSDELSTWYNSFKASINIEGEFDLVYMNIIEKSMGVFTGVINYKIDGIGKLKRF